MILKLLGYVQSLHIEDIHYMITWYGEENVLMAFIAMASVNTDRFDHLISFSHNPVIKYRLTKTATAKINNLFKKYRSTKALT